MASLSSQSGKLKHLEDVEDVEDDSPMFHLVTKSDSIWELACNVIQSKSVLYQLSNMLNRSLEELAKELGCDRIDTDAIQSNIKFEKVKVTGLFYPVWQAFGLI